MKSKTIIYSILLIILSINSYSQKGNPDKIKSLKVAYLTEQLELTTSEAEKFWPIYNMHQKKIHELRKMEIRRLKREISTKEQIDLISDAEALDLLNNILNTQQQVKNEQALMYEDLKKELSAKKLLKLLKAEKDFNREILEQYRKQAPLHH